MSPAIIFDMDGVIIRSEQLWNEREPPYLRRILGPDIASQISGKTRGLSASMIYEWAKGLGYRGSKSEMYKGYDVLAKRIYEEGPITEGIDGLIRALHEKDVILGLVSSSRKPWIMTVVGRLTNGNAFQFIESVDDHPELRPKPAPDGYIAAMRALKVTPEHTLIIEDSQTGINAAIASGAHVCCFTLHAEGELPHGIDRYVHSVKELTDLCYDFANSALK